MSFCDKLDIKPNIPIQVALRYVDGKDTQSKYDGAQVMFTTVDDQVIFVAPIVRRLIEEQGIMPGEEIQICKSVEKRGARKHERWMVERIDQDQYDQRQPAQPTTVVPAAPVREAHTRSVHANDNPADSALERDLRASVADARGRRAVRSAPPPPPTHMEGSPVAGVPLLSPLENSLQEAISAAQMAETFAKSRSYAIRFTSEDIRAMALTLYIQAAKEGGNRWGR